MSSSLTKPAVGRPVNQRVPGIRRVTDLPTLGRLDVDSPALQIRSRVRRCPGAKQIAVKPGADLEVESQQSFAQALLGFFLGAELILDDRDPSP